MEDLHKQDGKRKHYRLYWVVNPGEQPLWNPKWNLTLSEKSFRVGKVGKKCSTVKNVEEEATKVRGYPSGYLKTIIK